MNGPVRAMVEMLEVEISATEEELIGYDRETRTKALTQMLAAVQYQAQAHGETVELVVRSAALGLMIAALVHPDAAATWPAPA